MVIDSMQVSPLHLPFQAWPLMMAPVYGGGGAAASPGYTGSLMSSLVGSPGPTITGFFGQPQPGGQPGQTMSGLGSFVPFQAMPVMGPWGRQPVYMGGQFAPQAAMVPFQTTPATEQQALDSLMQEVTAGPIRKLHDYLEIHSPKHNQLAYCIPVVQEAAKAFGARDYTQALAQIYQAYRYISVLRASIPDLPSV